jgi:hypothetical protein
MKKTIEELKQIIKEELQRILSAEEDVPMDSAPTDYSYLAAGQDDMLHEDEELYYENIE